MNKESGQIKPAGQTGGDNSGSFVESIHSADYLQPYLENRTGARELIFERGRERVSLNGGWSFGVDQYDTCLRQRWFEEIYNDGDGRPLPADFCFDRWETIPVPSCWNLRSNGRFKDSLYLYEGSCVYTRTFDYIPGAGTGLKPGGRVFLRFGAANSSCKVFLNKQYLGMHTGGYTPFCFDVTGLLREHNRVLAVVNNTRRPQNVPADNTDWFNYGGIFRDVALIRVPGTFIRDFFIGLAPDGTFGRIIAKIRIDGPEQNGIADISIPELNIKAGFTVKNGEGKAELTAAPQLWSPDNPRLYDVTVTYGSDTVNERIGFREISVKNGSIYLNGREIFLKGVCAHEESVINGNAVTQEEIRENFALAKEMGCNFMRLAHYPHSEAAARIADEAGILLWEEIPVYWAIAFDNNETFADAENQLSELIIRDYNRASVIIWSVGNENADTDSRLGFMSRLVKKARLLDNTRLISAACLVDGRDLKIKDRLAEHLDIIGINEYYGWYEPDFSKLPRIFENSRPGKPVVITEFGADAKAGAKGAEGELYTEENQRAVYEKQVEVLGGIPYVKGIAPWIFFDFRCPRRLHPMQDYYNIKGLLSADKKYKKPAFYVMRNFYKST